MYLKLFDIFIMNATLMTHMMLIDRVMFVYISFILGGILILDAAVADDDVLVVFPFRDTKLGPKIYSAAMMLSLVTGNFFSLLP